MKFNTLLLAVATCSFAIGASARASTNETSRVVTDYTATLWADADGHPVGPVSAIAQDRDGYLWVGSTAGLFRFDGARFTPWNQLSESPLPAASVSSLLAGADGSLWVGFGDQAVLAHITGRTVDTKTFGGAGPVAAILEDRNGDLWVVAASSLLHRLGDRWMPVPIARDGRDVRARNIDRSRNGHLLISTDRGVFEGPNDRGVFELVIDGSIFSAGEDEEGRIWATAAVGFRVGLRGQATRTIGDAREGGGGYRVMLDHTGRTWIGTTGGGLWRVRLSGQEHAVVERTTLTNGLFNDAVQSILEDRDGNIWVGTTAGLHRLTRQALQSVRTEGVVSGVDLTARNNLVASTPSGLLHLAFNDGTWAAGRIHPTDRVGSLTRAKNGDLWGVRIFGGLIRLVGDRVESVSVPARFGMQPQLKFLAADPHEGIWLGDGERLLRWNGGEFSAVTAPIGGSTVPISLVVPGRDGTLSIAFADGRMGVRGVDGTLRVLREDPASKTSIVYAMAEGADGRIWLATDHGIARTLDDRVVRASPESGLPTGHIANVVEDGDGYLWADTNAGLLRIRSAEFDKAASTSQYHPPFEVFGVSDGALGTPTVSSRSGRAWDGKVWFVRSGALTIADPQLLRTRTTPVVAPVVIDTIKANERLIAPTASLSLASDTKRVQIEFTTVALSNSNRVRYRYRLDGVDRRWVAAGVRHTAVYTNLPPRRYHFEVQAGSDEYGWHTTPTVYQFAIRPAFYQTTAFVVAVAIAVGFLVFAAWRIRVRLVHRQYRAVLEERMRLSREIHDTLLQGVVGVALQLDNVSNDRGMPFASKVTLQEMRDQAEAYIREARRSIFDLRSPLLEEHDLVGALREVGQRAVANTSVRFTVTVKGHAKRYAPRYENELLRIAQEAITNAVRHSQPSHVAVVVAFQRSHVSLEVSDDGCGLERPRDDDTAHIGIASMKERAESLGGRVTIRQSSQGGTAIEAILPAPAAA